jgi:prepilin-type N-terminal cleavage/methylation domain-containing protein
MKQFHSQQGFSLIETLIAVSVLMMAIAGPLSIASRGLASARFARDQIIAFHLAREATELIRNKRDENVFSGDDWLDGMTSSPDPNCLAPNACTVDPTSGQFATCPYGICDPLSVDTINGVYDYDSGSNWEESSFTRSVSFETVPTHANNEIVANVKIEWDTGALSKEFTIVEHFFDWK